MNALSALIKRDTKLFFKDKGMFFTSMITPMILLVLYMTFLSKVYRDSFSTGFPEGFVLDEDILNGLVGGQLVSSLFAVCCITVAFCCNMLMVQDKVTGARKDINITPVKSSVVAMGYYISTVLSTIIVCVVAMGVCMLYLYNVGWYLDTTDVLLILLDMFLLVLFGTALSSCVNFFLSSQGQISAVQAIISAGYGFISGAYMPISQFGEGLQKVLSFFPGTYGTSLVRNHCMGGAFEEMEKIGVPAAVIDELKDVVDCNIYFFGDKVEISTMYIVLCGSMLALLGFYVLVNIISGKKAR